MKHIYLLEKTSSKLIDSDLKMSSNIFSNVGPSEKSIYKDIYPSSLYHAAANRENRTQTTLKIPFQTKHALAAVGARSVVAVSSLNAIITSGTIA